MPKISITALEDQAAGISLPELTEMAICAGDDKEVAE